jgi:CBS domain-containing protein
LSPSSSSPRSTPSSSLLGNLRIELMRVPPFALMAPAQVDRFIAQSAQAYFAPDEVVLSPDSGPVAALHLIRQGSISGRSGIADMTGTFEYVAGDLFPVSAVLAGRAVTATYTANEDTFCLQLPRAAVQALAAESAPFADFLNQRVLHILQLSRQAVQAASSSQTLAEQSLEARLATLERRTPLACTGDTPLADALGRMHAQRVGSVIVVDADGAPQGILTRHDILGRVTLAQQPLQAPIRSVMSAPIHTLTVQHTLQDAALLMSRHGVRHVPVTEAGRLVNIVSERDLFALQRQSLKQVSTQLRAAPDVAALRGLAGQIRRLARNLLGQGVQARQLTELISHLNDVLTTRLVQLVAQARGLDLSQACWLAFGSEGRGEQTVATDQDNGLIFVSDDPGRDRPAWLAMALEVNQTLDACGYPLCKGQVMAGNPACCLTPAEWLRRFGDWIAHGAPEDLLAASIYFDLRPLAGNLALAQPLRETIERDPARVPRFIKQMADNALRNRPPLNWRGGIDVVSIDGRATLDLKLRGTAIFVDAARLYALAHGLSAMGTRARLEAAAPLMGVSDHERAAWVRAFEILQTLRLQVQIGDDAHAESAADTGHERNANLIDVDSLNHIDQRVLKEALRAARQLQQRIELDYQR